MKKFVEVAGYHIRKRDIISVSPIIDATSYGQDVSKFTIIDVSGSVIVIRCENVYDVRSKLIKELEYV